MSEEIQGFRFRASTRVAYGEKVRLRFERGGDPLLAVCSDLSIEGMFVATHDLRPLGSVVEFEIVGGEGEVARGLADVVWARKEKVGPGRYAGMGLQFRYVDAGSRQLIAEMVERRHLEEQEAQEAEAPKPAAPPPPKPAADAAGLTISDKTLAGIAGGAAIAAMARQAAEIPSPGLADEFVLAGRGESSSPAPATPAARAAPVVLDGENAAAARRGFPWLAVLFVVLVVAAAAVAWWIWFGEGASSQDSPSRPPAETTGSQAGPAESAAVNGGATRSTAAAGEAPEADPAAPVEVREVSLIRGDANEALIAVELTRVPGGAGVRVSRLESPPRVLVRIPEAERVPGGELEVTTELVTGLRTAVHLEQGANELHLVFDLANEQVRAESRLEGERLLLRLSNG